MGLPGPRESQQCRPHKALSGDNSSFLPPFVLPPRQLSHAPRAAPGPFQKVPSKTPLSPSTRRLAGLWCRAAKWVLLGRRGVHAMQFCLGTDVFTSLSVTEGVVSKLAQIAWKKASGESGSPAFSSLPPAVHSLFFSLGSFILLGSFSAGSSPTCRLATCSLELT